MLTAGVLGSAVAAGADAMFFDNVRVPMRDGVSLAADVYLPSNRAARVGCLLQFSPYGATKAGKPWSMDRAANWGVATVSADCRGLCHSEGKFEPWDPSLPDDAFDLLSWISAQEWSNGRVVMVGGSYPGATQLACMRSGHPALVACAPSVITFDVYSVNFCGGIPMSQFQKGWHTGLAGAGSWDEMLRHPDARDPYWIARADRRDLAKSKGRAFYQAGWFDKIGPRSFESFTEMPAGSFLRVGPWSHGVNTFDKPDIDYSTRGGLVTEDLEIDFLRSALEGREPQTASLPGRIMYYMMGRDEWRYADEWPPKGVTERRLFLADGLGLSSVAPEATGSDSFRYDPANPVPTRGGRVVHAGGQYEQSEVEARDDVLCYTTAPLEADVEVVGKVRASIKASSTATVADVMVKLVDVWPDGRAYNVVDSACRAAFEPGKAKVLAFDVDDTAYAFPAGHRIRLEVAGSCHPHYDLAPEAATTSIHRGGPDGSFITLPISAAR
jgi:hypothetical protein